MLSSFARSKRKLQLYGVTTEHSQRYPSMPSMYTIVLGLVKCSAIPPIRESLGPPDLGSLSPMLVRNNSEGSEPECARENRMANVASMGGSVAVPVANQRFGGTKMEIGNANSIKTGGT